MLEYIFFYEKPCNNFREFLTENGVPHDLEHDREELLVVLPDGLDDDLIEKIEAHYESLMALSEQMANEHDDGRHYTTAGVRVVLTDGRAVFAEVDPQLVNRMLSALTFSEVDQFVAAIVQAIEQPDERTICQRHRDGCGQQ